MQRSKSLTEVFFIHIYDINLYDYKAYILYLLLQKRILVGFFRMQKVRFSGKIYFQAFSEGWLNSLAVYLYLCKMHSGKTFYYERNTKTKFISRLSKKIGISQNSLSSHLKILVKNEMVTIIDGEIKLIGNKSNMANKLYLNEATNTLQEIKELLKSIPFISNLYSQKKAFEKKEHQQYLRNNPFAARSKNLRRRIFRQIVGGEVFKKSNKEIFCGIKMIGKLTNQKSTATICKYKKLMKIKGVINYTNSTEILHSGTSISDYRHLLRYKLIPKGSFYKSGFILRNKPTQFTIDNNIIKNISINT